MKDCCLNICFINNIFLINNNRNIRAIILITQYKGQVMGQQRDVNECYK